MTRRYTFDNSDARATAQLDRLAAALDPVTTARIGELDLPAGARCWEVGAGGGSVAAWLAAHVGPAGSVVASDIDTEQLHHLQHAGNIRVVAHDLTTLTPPGDDGGPFDLIHARLVLMHLPARRQILKALAAHLAPGGWLLVEEFDCTRPLRVYTSRSVADTEVFVAVTAAIVAVIEGNGADLGWAHQVHPAMADEGLTDLHTRVHAESWTGGSPGALLHQTNSHQLAGALEARGFTSTALDRFRDVVADPAHAAASYELVSTRGRRQPGPA